VKRYLGFIALAFLFASCALMFRHRDDVQRLIFIATPHRGSELASGFIGRLAARLIRAPQSVRAFRSRPCHSDNGSSGDSARIGSKQHHHAFA